MFEIYSFFDNGIYNVFVCRYKTKEVVFGKQIYTRENYIEYIYNIKNQCYILAIHEV